MTQRIAKYEVIEKIAEGGFGTVYKARDPFIKRLVAIKTCSVADADMARRFFREAEIAGRFDHPNVTIVHDFGVEDQTAYLVQEYLTGEDLLQKIRRRDPLPLRQKVEYLIQVANGLAYAHSQQVIHRDIKPANLRVLETGHVKILDFGIAKLATAATQLTQKGMAVGTLGYLSPEQLRDQELDTRTDIFSYGVVAYELLTYARPFQGKQLSALMDEILHKTPPPLVQHVVDCPPSLERVVALCLEKDRDRRYQTFDEVAADLEEVRRELTASRPVAEGATASGVHAVPRAAPTAASKPAKGGDGGPITRPIQLPGGGSGPAPPTETPPAAPPVSMTAAEGAAMASRSATTAVAPPPPWPAREAPAAVASASVAAGESADVASAPPQLPPLPPLPPLPQPPMPARETASASAGNASAPTPAAPVVPAAAAPAATAPAAAPRAARAARSTPMWVWIAAAGAGMLVVLAVGAWLLLSFARHTTPTATPAATTAPTQAAPVAANSATVVVLGSPWGELTALKDATGRELPLPARRETPLVLTLPAGHYVATLRHPNAPAPVSCEVDATNGQAATCRAELLPLDPLQYFKEAGWWK